MAAQSFDTDQISKIQSAKDEVMDAFGKMSSAFEASITVAHKNQIPVLEQECTAGLEAAQQITKLAEQLKDSIDSLTDYLNRMDHAFNND